jgi:hypothetical protein
MNSSARYLFQLSILSICCGIILYLLNTVAPARFQGDTWPFILLFFMVATYGFHLILSRIAKGDHKAFIRAYMGMSGAKLLLYLFIITVFLLFNKAAAASFILQFFICYFMFSAFEVYKLFRASK